MKPTPLIEKVKEQVAEADRLLGGLTDSHLKWIKAYCLFRFGLTKVTQDVTFDIDFTSRALYVTVRNAGINGKMAQKVWWWRQKWMLWRTKDTRDMPRFLGIPDWIILFGDVRPDLTVTREDEVVA